MWLVNGVGVVMAELKYNVFDPGVVLRGQRVSDKSLEFQGTALALVVELVVQRFSDVDIHTGGRRRSCLTLCAGLVKSGGCAW